MGVTKRAQSADAIDVRPKGHLCVGPQNLCVGGHHALGSEGKSGMVRIGAVHAGEAHGNTVEEIKRLGEALRERAGLGR